jgi:hypothetical protein
VTTTGRTVWLAKDAAWWRRARIIELGEEFGSDGPAVIDWLSCEAKAQNDGGWVKTGQRAVSRGCFVDPVTVGRVLSTAVTLGLLDEFKSSGSVFTCRISGWKDDQEKVLAAARKAAQRARAADETPAKPAKDNAGQDETQRDESRSVPPRPEKSLTGQDRTVEEPPLPPQGGRARDLRVYEQELGAWVDDRLPGATPSVVGALASFLRRDGEPVTAQALTTYAEAHPQWALYDELAA